MLGMNRWSSWSKTLGDSLIAKSVPKQIAIIFGVGFALGGFIEAFACRTGYYHYAIAKQQIHAVNELDRLATQSLDQASAMVALEKSLRETFYARRQNKRRAETEPSKEEAAAITATAATGFRPDEIKISDLRVNMLAYLDRDSFRWRPVPHAMEILTLAVINTRLSRMPGHKMRLR